MMHERRILKYPIDAYYEHDNRAENRIMQFGIVATTGRVKNYKQCLLGRVMDEGAV